MCILFTCATSACRITSTKTNMNASTNTNTKMYVRVVVILWVRNDKRFVSFGSFYSSTHIRTRTHTWNQTRTRIQSFFFFWDPTATLRNDTATATASACATPPPPLVDGADVAVGVAAASAAAAAATGVCVDRGWGWRWGCLHRASIPKTIFQRFQFGFAYHAMMTAALIETKYHRELCVFWKFCRRFFENNPPAINPAILPHTPPVARLSRV